MTNSVADYGWASPHGPQSCGYISPAILALLRRLSAHRVLDLGAGNGALCAELSAAGFDVVGMECDARGVEIAQQACPSVRFYRLGVEDDPAGLTADERPFDAVVSTEVIEHLYSPHLLPEFASRALVAGGHLIVTTPYHGYLKNLALALLDKWDSHHTPLWHGGHIKFFSRRTLTRLLEASGFRVVAFSGVGRLPWLWKSMVVVARRV
jgi:2-polyprenyl-3-methyl-5-hydroxy-6-metoxy-1,4-benzoquinol methylase